MAKAGQNMGFKKPYFNTGMSAPGGRNIQEILGNFLSRSDDNKKARNISRNSKSKKRK